MISLSELGAQVATHRKQRGLSQSDLANKAQVSRPTIHLIESGRATEIGYSKLVRILAAVGLELRLEKIAPQRPTLEDLLKDQAEHD